MRSRAPRRIAVAWASALAAAFALPARTAAQSSPEWTEPVPPFAIAEHLYYVGSEGLASYLITTSAGHILINSSLEASVPLLRASVEQLGFKFEDVEILLVSHAHWDHCAGSAAVVAETGARYMVMEGDVAVVESGGELDFQYGDEESARYPPTKVDRVLHDGDEVHLGEAVLVARLTPGHTKGCTTWTLKAPSIGAPEKLLDVVIVGSPNVNPGYKLVNNPAYWEAAADYWRMFVKLGRLPCDVFLGAHGSYFGLADKRARLAAGDKAAFVDREGYARFVAEKQKSFEDELAEQVAALAVADDAPRVEIADRAGMRAGPLVVVQLRAPLREEDGAFLDELHDFAVSCFGGTTWTNVGPDSDYREIVFTSRGRTVRLRSWHPLAERGPGLVAASYGLTALKGKDPEAFLADDDPAYVAKREAFDEIAERLRQHYATSGDGRAR